MCTVVVLRRPGHDWPLLLAANRDEMADRPWSPPARHWEDRADVVAGRDDLAGGTWLGLNDSGVVAGILNRFRTLGPQDGKRSRGELVLEALDHADAADAAEALAALDPAAYRPFNMVIADNRDAFWVRHAGQPGARGVEVLPIPEGLSMLTAFELNDAAADPRIALHRPRFLAAPPPDPETGSWESWQALLASREAGPPDAGVSRGAAMCFQMDTGFGTRSSSLIALPSPERAVLKAPAADPVWLFAAGPPDRAPYSRVAMA
ncbi:NRDE family protein [Novispirillum sp. DQ9]|uniref:NRDE family protein n=1 Tax=Novispirillum sp. DQ9 TaxID=3398612 RepID=UPI003C7E8F44